MAKYDGPLSASFFNPLIDDFRKWVIETRESLLKEFYASGYPPGTVPLTPEETYQQLIRFRAAGSPLFWHNQEAQDELRQLEQRFGPAPELTPSAPPPWVMTGPNAVPGSVPVNGA